MSYGTSLGITLPTVSVTAGPTYATQLRSALTTLINVLESKVTPSGMDISADLDFKSGATYSAALNLERATFEDKSAALNAATYPTSLYLVGGELWFNDDAGNQVQVTSGGAVNVSSTGGVTGSGYGSGGVEVNWDAGNVKYRLRSGNGANDFASAHVNDVLLNDGSGNTITVAAPSISSDYTFTLPTAVPAGEVLVTMDASGNLDAPAEAPAITLASGNSVTVQGAGDFKHGEKKLKLNASNFLYTTGWTRAGSGYIQSVGSGADTDMPLPLKVGDRIKAIYVQGCGTGSIAVNWVLMRHDGVTPGGRTNLGGSSTGTSTTWGTSSKTDYSETVSDDNTKSYYLNIDQPGASGAQIGSVTVVFDRP